MKNGDLSNRSSPVVAFNIDTLLFTDEVKDKEGLSRKIKDFFTLDAYKDKREYFNRKVNGGNIDTIYKVWKNTDYDICLVTFKPFVEEIEKFLFDEVQFQCYNRIVGYKDLQELQAFLLTGRYFIYVDGSYENVNFLGGNTIHISDVAKYMKGAV